MRISAGHPEAENPLIWLAAGALVRRGAEVRIDANGENLVRRARAEDRSTAPVIVEVQGLGNLFHELVHVLRAGVLDDDHGIDYAQMPFQFDRAEHRRLLWDELAASVVSCAYATPGDGDGWFAEQIETQPVFYGMAEDPARFARALDDLLDPGGPHLAQLDAVVRRAFSEVEDCLVEAGAGRGFVVPSARLSFQGLWEAYRRRRSAWFGGPAGQR